MTAATICATSRVRFGADQAKQRDGEADRERRGRRAHGGDHAIGAEPAPAAAPVSTLMNGAASGSAIIGHRQRHGGDAHGEQTLPRRPAKPE